MIRRTLKRGLLAAVAVFAILPTVAGATPASAAAPRPAPDLSVQHLAQLVLPAQRAAHLFQHRPALAQHRAHHARRHARHVLRHHARRTHHVVVRRASYHRRALPALGRVATHRTRLNVRYGPGTGYRVVGHRHAGRLVRVTCKTYGSRVFGNHVWYRLPQHRGYVSAHYVRTGRAVPWC
ncbi:SH3 domain-containing protein [Streptomyces sp. NPDC048297]|uniref:SH3 domain-containing protein n=1 Tax=Streptomyces sp. NPDC048297 TaxID=3365531 RepID=UPI00371A92FA